MTTASERDRLYRIATGDAPGRSTYERNTTREFPVVILEGVPAPERHR